MARKKKSMVKPSLDLEKIDYFDPRYTDEQLFKDIETIQCLDLLKTTPSLTQEDVDYYMSLPEKDSSK